MAKPTRLPEWATDATYTSGSDIGQPVSVEPSLAFKKQGTVPGTSYKGSHENDRKENVFDFLQGFGGGFEKGF